MDSESGVSSIRIEVAYAMPDKQVLLEVTVPEGSTVGDGIELSAIRADFPDMEINPASVGIFSRKVALSDVLQEGDRIEIYRPLIVDPKELRRQRARKPDSTQ